MNAKNRRSRNQEANIVLASFINSNNLQTSFDASPQLIIDNSFSQKTSSVHEKSSSQSCLSVTFLQLAKQQLLHYDDINQEDFECNPDLQDYQSLMNMSPQQLQALGVTQQMLQRLKFQQDYSSCMDEGDSREYMNTHTNSVPIGEDFQASIPPLISSQTYFQRSSKLTQRERICKLKVHDPITNPKFFERYSKMIAYQFGRQQLCYEDVALMNRYFQQFCQSELCNFEEYLANWGIQRFWEEYFISKDRLDAKKSKPKKKRGRKPNKA